VGPHHGAPGQFPVLGLRDRDHAQRRATLGDAAFEAAHRRARYAGSYYYKCLEYLPNPNVNLTENWQRWESASGEWLAMPLADYGEYCENQ
jgi:hypothetical protein